jgi:monofunctional biosynthetic peptidoglycan transglycosylase
MKKETGRKIIRVIKKIVLGLFIFQLIYLFICKWLYPPITITQLNSLIGTWGDSIDFKRSYISYDSISPNLKLAVLAAEDLHFYKHTGIDWWSVKKAKKYNQEHPDEPLIGASSISQQTAKNVFLWQGRSWVRKGLELYFTKLIEWTWGKKRILAVYLNVIEMGNGIYGIEAASQYYFKKQAKDLNESEAAMIAICLPNPKLYKPGQLGEKLQKKYERVLYFMSLLKEYPAVQQLIQ